MSLVVTMFIMCVPVFHDPHHEFRTVFWMGSKAEILDIEKWVGEVRWEFQVRTLSNCQLKNESNLCDITCCI
jgi:hypothetical protein